MRKLYILLTLTLLLTGCAETLSSNRGSGNPINNSTLPPQNETAQPNNLQDQITSYTIPILKETGEFIKNLAEAFFGENAEVVIALLIIMGVIFFINKTAFILLLIFLLGYAVRGT